MRRLIYLWESLVAENKRAFYKTLGIIIIYWPTLTPCLFFVDILYRFKINQKIRRDKLNNSKLQICRLNHFLVWLSTGFNPADVNRFQSHTWINCPYLTGDKLDLELPQDPRDRVDGRRPKKHFYSHSFLENDKGGRRLIIYPFLIFFFRKNFI